jgi:hypothetical protein
VKLGRSILAHSILAIGGLVLAYLVWTGDGAEVSEAEVTLVQCSPDQIERVELVGDDKDVRLELSREGDRRTAWFTVTRRPAEGEPSTERFVGSDAVTEFLRQVAPFRARRSLGELDAEQLGEVGLAEPEGRLTLRCAGQSSTFELGGRAYGTGDRYVRAERGGAVHLVSTDRLSSLESAEFRLMERSLHTFEWRDVVSLTLRASGQERRLLQHNRLDEARAEWVDEANPERRNETYGNWLSRFPRMRVQRYLDADARPGADLEGMSAAPERVLRMEMTGTSGELGFLELERIDADQPAYYAKTETTRSWVRVPTSVAQQIEDDLRSMLGLEPIERRQPTTARGAAGSAEGAAEGEPGTPGAAEGEAEAAAEAGSAEGAEPAEANGESGAAQGGEPAASPPPSPHHGHAH